MTWPQTQGGDEMQKDKVPLVSALGGCIRISHGISLGSVHGIHLQGTEQLGISYYTTCKILLCVIYTS